MNIYEQVLSRWKHQGVLRNPAVSQGLLDKFEEKYGFRLPGSLRRLLLLANGMCAGEYDRENSIRVWSLDELGLVNVVAPELASQPYENSLIFADYSVWVHAYAVSLDSGQVVIVGGREPVFVTSSLESFLAMYVANAPNLFPKPAEARAKL